MRNSDMKSSLIHISKRLTLVSLAIFFAVVSANAQATGKPPIIIIPGISGSQLVNPSTQKPVWFSIKRDKDDDLRLPMTSAVLSRNRDSLQPTDIIRTVELPVLPDVEVYQTLIDALKERGYTEATWNDPKATDVFYVFAYDWRRDNVETAQLLMQKMTAAKRRLRAPKLKFDILAHSMGGLIARYAAMYGSAELPRGGSPVPTWAGAAHIEKLMMFGTPNEGAFSAFDTLLNGYPIVAERKLPLVDDLRPEDVMTNPSVFQLIPHQNSARFLDENLQPMTVDIYKVETWIKYGWGAIADPKFLGKLRDAEGLALTNKDIKPAKLDKNANTDDRILARTTYAQVRAYFVSALDRARRFHLAMDATSKRAPVQIFAYGGNCAPTLDAAVLIRDDKKGSWTTLVDAKDIKTADGKQIKKDEVKAAMFTPGDGRVTKRSLLSETELAKGGPEMIKIPLASSFFACGLHTKLFLEKPIQDSFWSSLVVERTGKQ
jgi:pimeloyl-ACP methyl ester carboxylesterase